MNHQIKKLISSNKPGKLSGIVEVDESYVGMKIVNMSKKKRAQMFDENGNAMDNKTGIMGFISRDGLVKVEVMTGAKTFKDRVKDNVAKDAIVVTDGHTGYEGLNVEFAGHEAVNKLAGEYKRDDWHTNNIEGFWSQLKRMLKGTHIHVNAEYLQLYADEACFRYMQRHNQANMFETILSHVTS